MLIRGDHLNQRQKQQVLGAFVHRWTTGNTHRESVYKGRKPRIPLISDSQWLKEHAFHFTKDGSRLMANRHYAEPAFMAENNPSQGPSKKDIGMMEAIIPENQLRAIKVSMEASIAHTGEPTSHLTELINQVISRNALQNNLNTRAAIIEAARRTKGFRNPQVLCRCCGKPVYNTDGYPIHTKCIPTHWGKHAHGINASKCKEFGHKAKKNPGLKTFDDIKVLKSKPKNWSHMLPVHARENRMGHMTITFSDGTSIYAQSDYDIDSTVDSMARIGSQYYILDEHGWTF